MKVSAGKVLSLKDVVKPVNDKLPIGLSRELQMASFLSTGPFTAHLQCSSRC